MRHEGEVLYAYQDSAPEKYWTIGVGRLIDKRKGGGISHEEAMFLLGNDIDAKLTDAARFTWFGTLNDVRQNVILNMLFNLGFDGVSKFVKMTAAIKVGDWAEAAAQMLDSDWKNDVGSRAYELAQMMETGEWPT